MPRAKKLPKQYRIVRRREGDIWCRVDAVCHSEPIKHVVFHSPSGFEQGDGYGAADLALSILADWFEESPEDVMAFIYGESKKEIRSVGLHQKFKEDFIASIPKLKVGERAFIQSKEIEEWLEKQTQ